MLRAAPTRLTCSRNLTWLKAPLPIWRARSFWKTFKRIWPALSSRPPARHAIDRWRDHQPGLSWHAAGVCRERPKSVRRRLSFLADRHHSRPGVTGWHLGIGGQLSGAPLRIWPLAE